MSPNLITSAEPSPGKIIGVVGAGRISERHIWSINTLSYFALGSICDIDAAACAKACKECPEAVPTDSFEELIRNPTIDIIAIATPSGMHADMACAAMQSGKDIILEKPIALSIADADKIIRVQKETGRTAAVVLQNRTNQAVQEVKEGSTDCGVLLYISSNVFWYRPQAYYDDGWHGTKNMDGGVLMNQGTHYVDMLRYLSGKEAASVAAFGGTFGHRMESEDVITINIVFTDGTLGNLQVNSITYPENMEGSITLFYEKATIKIGGPALNTIEYWKQEGQGKKETILTEKIKDIYGNGHHRFYEALQRYYVGDSATLPATLEDGRAAVAFIEHTYTSMKENRVVQCTP